MSLADVALPAALALAALGLALLAVLGWISEHQPDPEQDPR